MKMFSSYLKEMKIASRGFYFYIEILVAVILLLVVLFAINPEPDGKQVEYLYYDMSDEVFDYLVDKDITEGRARWIDDTEFELNPIAFELKNEDTGKVVSYDFKDSKTVTARTFVGLREKTGKIGKTAHILDSEEDALRLSFQNGNVAATTTVNEEGDFSYRYFLQGYETDRYSNMLYVLHTYSQDEIDAQMDTQVIRETGANTVPMDNQEAVVPIFVVIAGALMGIFIIMAYVFLDKDEGVIKAFAVTPSSIWNYLVTKIFVVMTTVIISSTIIVIPIMKLRPNYLLFYLFLLVTTFAFSSLGLLISSFFDTISKAFGVLYTIMITLALPAFSYYISSFDPVWLRFFPTYPALQVMKDLLMGQGDIANVILYSLVFLVSGILLLAMANSRFKKTLTV
ncbi:MAG: ABC transporter permease [Carnobacterium sp.]|nr:ABC transporter permease [Carnobacterium sp.]